MTRQEAFNKAVAGLASQGFSRAAEPVSGQCLYIQPSTGKRCAFGWLMQNPNPTFVGYNSDYAAASREARDIIDKLGPTFCQDLQLAHDRGYSNKETEAGPAAVDDPVLMKQHLLDFAKNYSLEVPSELL